MKNIKKSALILSMILCAAVCYAEWQIVEVSTAPFSRKNYDGPSEIEMTIKIRNISKNKVYIYGEDWGSEGKFYLIESFIKNTANDVWERQNAGMGGGIGTVGFLPVEPGETITSIGVLYKHYVGNQMILTFRRANSAGDKRGNEILLGPFKIPAPKKNK